MRQGRRVLSECKHPSGRGDCRAGIAGRRRNGDPGEATINLASAPVVQDVSLVGDLKAGGEESVQGPRDVGGLHVFAADVVLVNEQETTVATTLSLPGVVELLKVGRILS